MKMRTRLFLLACAVLLGGCAMGPTYTETASSIPKLDPGVGRIYFYRNSAMGAALQPNVVVNGNVVGPIRAGGFFYLDRPPGNYEVVASTEVERKLNFSLDKGQTRYVRFRTSFSPFVDHIYPELVENGEGEKDIQDCRYSGGQ